MFMVSHLIVYDEFKEILSKQNRSPEDIADIERAFEYANKLHEGQYRISEEPYIIHPIEVAKILLDLKMDKSTIISAFLHDILEDTDTKPEDLAKEFGEDVLKLVQGVTKLGKLHFQSKEERQAENFRRMLVAMAQDIRIIFLKLADRLHNMRTLNYMAQNKQKKTAQETLDIFAPLANRLGIGKIKAELEDLALRYINPEKYYEIARKIAQTKAQRDQAIASLIEEVKIILKHNSIEAKIYGRAKHYYSIYNKMNRLNITFDQLYDTSAIRVLVDEEKDCYGVLGLIHAKFKPIPGRFKDYIAMPKSNGYRSLHTTVIGPKNKPFEIQIRTKEMHEVAEYGIAAHWKYKESGSVKSNTETDAQFSWMKKLVELDKDSSDSKEFLENVKLDIFSDQVFAFSPRGDVIDLPAGSSPVDFAYRIHTEIGHKTVGALVNGRIVTLDTKLKNGDIVEILTSKQPMPKIDWLNFVKTKSAASKIRLWFKKNKREDNLDIGKMQLEAALSKSVFDDLYKTGEFERVSKEMNYKSAEDLFAALGYGETTLHKITNKLKRPTFQPMEMEETHHEVKRKKVSKKDDIIGLEGMLWNLAKCCCPIPGEPIVGVVTRSKGVTVHRLNCKCLFDIEPERMMDIKWANTISSSIYSAHLRIECQDRVGLLKDIIGKISDTDTNILYTSTYVKNKKFGIVDVGIELNNIDVLQKVILNIQSLQDVYSVRRLEQRGMSSKHSHKKNNRQNKNHEKY
ncbi:MAG: bifunctional (p)ppGpp synthetase/guanosine-3',5'-bis(diphosphate) 3'-pyrophosphohydrolase [Cyanobacteria bacterium SIG30]|nr:bifunctional (p)ppGpp synthetase/guanosine-3',5'-bis(diphosphate) 3'-pyrophosphohydrolase [Cyanobacteria bacterium SIG30]